MKDIFLDPYHPLLDEASQYACINLDDAWIRILPYATTTESRLLHYTCLRDWISADYDDPDYYDEVGNLMAWKLGPKGDEMYSLVIEIIDWLAGVNEVASSIWKEYQESLAIEDNQLRRDKRTRFMRYIEKLVPQKESPKFWVPADSCRDIAPWAWYLANKWRPNYQWHIVQGEKYSTVVCPSKMFIFDLFNYKDRDGSQIIRWARQ